MLVLRGIVVFTLTALSVLDPTSSAFQAAVPTTRPSIVVRRTGITTPPRTILYESEEDAVKDDDSSSSGTTTTTSTLQELIRDEFKAFYNLLSMNDEIWNTIAEAEASEDGVTIFAPSNTAFDNLGEKKLQQLKDLRNEEIAKKMGLYHVVATEAVTAARLRTEDWTGPKPTDKSMPRPIKVQALVTMAGEVPVGRSKSGGIFLGIGAKEDGDVVIGPEAKMVKSYKVGKSIVHEIDSLISPEVLWRYCDQLRIPGF